MQTDHYKQNLLFIHNKAIQILYVPVNVFSDGVYAQIGNRTSAFLKGKCGYSLPFFQIYRNFLNFAYRHIRIYDLSYFKRKMGVTEQIKEL